MLARPVSKPLAYDPFGEPIEADQAAAIPADDWRLRAASVAVFWTLAVLLTAGRAYHGDRPAPALAGAPEQATVLAATLR